MHGNLEWESGESSLLLFTSYQCQTNRCVLLIAVLVISMGDCSLFTRMGLFRVLFWNPFSWAALVFKRWANFIFHTASVHPAVMGTWCTDPRLDQQLQAVMAPTSPAER